MSPATTRILVVDDDPSARLLVTTVLKRAGYAVEAYETAEACLAAVAGAGGPPQVLVLDRHLPGMDGIRLFREVRKTAPNVQGILITAFPSKETREAATEAGLLDYVVKPFQVSDLLAVCQAAIALATKPQGT